MRYLKVFWHHELPDEPVVLYSELNDEGYETRKVEVFRDGHQDFASDSTSSGVTSLGETPIPSLQEIADQEEFTPLLVDSAEFEGVWRMATGSTEES